MEDPLKLTESLLERAAEYGKTSYELVKLKALATTSDVVSSFLPHFVGFLFVAVFMLFFSMGFAFWLGEILGKSWSGFVIVAGFYGIAGIGVHFFMNKWLKKQFCNYIIKQVLN